jgi:hypothetical protein
MNRVRQQVETNQNVPQPYVVGRSQRQSDQWQCLHLIGAEFEFSFFYSFPPSGPSGPTVTHSTMNCESLGNNERPLSAQATHLP